MPVKNKEKEILLFLSLIFVSLVLLGLDKLSWLNWLKRPFESLTNPVKEKIRELNYRITGLQDYKEKGSINLEEKVKYLELENADLKVKLENLEKENVSMKKLLGAPLPASWKFLPAQVLNIKEGMMTINQGSDNGLKENQLVVFENVLLGKIIKVNPRLSKVMLANNKDSKIKVKISGLNSKGILKADTNGLLVLDEVLQEVKLSKGQIVVTSGEEEIYPPNLLIGKIESVEENEAAVYQKAVVQPLVDYQSLENVFVIK